MDTKLLMDAWLTAKQEEKKATESRRQIEDALILAFEVPDDMDGVFNPEADGFKVKITGRINRKVDSEAIQQIATDNGTEQHLSTLFTWKPTINMAVWKATDNSITDPLRSGITAKPGRPSFTITKETE